MAKAKIHSVIDPRASHRRGSLQEKNMVRDGESRERRCRNPYFNQFSRILSAIIRLGNIAHSFGDIGSNQKIIIAVLPHNNSSLCAQFSLSLSLAIISICLSVCYSPDSLNVFFLRSIPTRFNFFCTRKSL